VKLRFQADADLDGRVFRGLRRIAPEIDIRTATEAALIALPDYDVLRIAAEHDRILISQHRRTMPRHFEAFLKERSSPGVILLRGGISIGSGIDEIALIWHASDAEEWLNRLIWIPL
jgi:Domain of unknown function (DUF5615)